MRPSEALARHREKVLDVLAGFNVRDARIFGSVARGEDEQGSDLDLIVDLGETGRLTDLFRIEDVLESLLGVRVDVHMKPYREGRFALHIADDLRAI